MARAVAGALRSTLFFDLGRLPGRLVNQVIDLGPYQVLDDSRAEGVEFPAFPIGCGNRERALPAGVVL